MRRDVIQFVNMQRITVPMVSDDEFQFRDDLKHHWLQKACFWILRKIGAYRKFGSEVVETINVQPESVLTQIFRQREELEDVHFTDASQIIIGGDDYMEMMSSPEIRQYMEFGADVYSPKGIIGLTIKVVPWMKGIVVIP